MIKLNRIILILAIAVSILIGCSDEPSRPKVISPGPTISNIWPNDDGRSWTYRFVQRTWDSFVPTRFYATEYQVPPLPAMSEIAAILYSQPIGENPDSMQGTYRIQFMGLITTPPGVTAQNLTEEVYGPEVSPGAITQLSSDRAFLARLMIARPDLKAKIAAHLYSGHDLELSRLSSSLGSSSALFSGNTVARTANALSAQALNPLLIHGGAWRKTDMWIGTYGVIDTLLAWKFVESPLFIGHKFTFQLAPSLADDIFEHCQVLRIVNIQTQAGVFRRAIECLYLIDFGILEGTDAYGHAIGYARLFDYGTVVYVPNVGPVYSYERMYVEPGDTLTAGAGDLTLSLVATDSTGN